MSNQSNATGHGPLQGAYLTVKNLKAGYGGLAVLNGVNLRVKPNSLTVLVGANGASKTTLLRALSGIIPALGGEMELDGTALANRSVSDRVRLGLTLVPEGRHLFGGMTVRENLELGAYLLPKALRAASLARVIEYFPRLGERLTQAAGTMSGGEQQMVAVGRAMMSRPRCLLLDEPSLGLAPMMIDELFRALREISNEGTSVLLIEQNVYQALSVADHGYVLSHGHVVAEGEAQELRDSPLIREAYLGEPLEPENA